VAEPVVLWRSKRRRLHVLQARHKLIAEHQAAPLELEPLELPEAAGESEAAPAPDREQPGAAVELGRRRRASESVESPEKSPGKRRKVTSDSAAPAAAEQEQAADYARPGTPKKGKASAPAAPSGLLQLALHAMASSKARKVPQPPPPPARPAQAKTPTPPAMPPSKAPAAKLDARAEIDRIRSAQEPDELLGLARGESNENEIAKAWKRLVLLLHPDKLQRLDAEAREAGAEALLRVHSAKEELKRRSQVACAQEPDVPTAAGMPKCLEQGRGRRKYELKWSIPETQDPARPVEKYEVWGPRYFSENGDPYEWTLLATLPPLQNHFIIVEEAPTQQDVMWAADRIHRPCLPIAVHAANGKGSSEALTFELPWASLFPWLRGCQSVLCAGCFRLQRQQGPWTQCDGCGGSMSDETRIVLRCTDCQGNVLWNPTGLNCTCCLRRFAQVPVQKWPQNVKRLPQHSQPRMMQRSWSRAAHQSNQW